MIHSRASAAYLWLAIPLLQTLNQACIKLLALHMDEHSFDWAWLKLALQTPYAWLILVCETVTFVLWMTVLADTAISKATPITSITYVMILTVSWTWFKEPLLPLQIIGSLLIIGGGWLIATASPRAKDEI